MKALFYLNAVIQLLAPVLDYLASKDAKPMDFLRRFANGAVVAAMWVLIAKLCERIDRLESADHCEE